MLEITHVGGPTAVLGYGGLRWLTDPTLSPPGEYAGGLVKTTGQALEQAVIEPVDVVLLSHEHHSDNLDPAGREFLPRVGRVLTTVEGAEQIGGSSTTGLKPWDSVEVERPQGGAVRVTAVPAQHGPDGSEQIMGPVIGFVLDGPGLELVYISGDNASLDVVRTIAGQVDAVDVAVLFAGAVQLAHRFDCAYLTLSSDFAAEALPRHMRKTRSLPVSAIRQQTAGTRQVHQTEHVRRSLLFERGLHVAGCSPIADSPAISSPTFSCCHLWLPG